MTLHPYPPDYTPTSFDGRLIPSRFTIYCRLCPAAQNLETANPARAQALAREFDWRYLTLVFGKDHEVAWVCPACVSREMDKGGGADDD